MSSSGLEALPLSTAQPWASHRTSFVSVSSFIKVRQLDDLQSFLALKLCKYVILSLILMTWFKLIFNLTKGKWWEWDYLISLDGLLLLPCFLFPPFSLKPHLSLLYIIRNWNKWPVPVLFKLHLNFKKLNSSTSL